MTDLATAHFPERELRIVNPAAHQLPLKWQTLIPCENHNMFAFYSNRLGCIGSIVASIVGTLLLLAVFRLFFAG